MGLAPFLIAMAAVATLLTSQEEPVNLPPFRREYCSASKQFCLVLATADRWKSPRATAELRRSAQGRIEVLWKKTLPQNLGPRVALVADNGQVLCFDEWIDVVTPMTLMLFDPSGKLIRQATFQEVQKALGVPGSDVVSAARFGPWMMERPVLDESAGRARVRAGGRTLFIRLADGQLSAQSP